MEIVPLRPEVEIPLRECVSCLEHTIKLQMLNKGVYSGCIPKRDCEYVFCINNKKEVNA